MAKQYIPFEQIRDKARQILLRDSGRLSTSNYTPYPGKTIAPMSSMTQRARGLAEKRTEYGMPYKEDLDKLANTPIEGLTDDNIRALQELNYNTADRGLNTTSDRLREQFGNSFNRYQGGFNRNTDNTNRLKTDELKFDINLLNPEIKKLQGKKNRAAFETVLESGKSKYNREKALIDLLNEYGSQKHGIVNKGLTAEKARFDAERDEPYQRIDSLNAVLNAMDGVDGSTGHPDVVNMQGKQLIKALQAYGVDTGQPIDKWLDAPRTNLPVYQGKLVEPVNDELAKSYELAENISPFYKDKNYLDRKITRKSIVNSGNSVTDAVDTLPENLRPKFESLDEEARKKIEADLTALNSKYIKQGMYGSNSHLKAVTNRIQDLMAATQESRADLIKKGLIKNVTDREYEDINTIGKLSQYDQLANTEFGGMLDDTKRSNLKGLEKWKNEQENNEQLYKSYQAEKGGMNPKLLTNARNTGYEGGVNSGINTLFDYFNNKGIDLSSVSDLQNRYSEMEKERSSSLDKIKSLEDYKLQAEELAKKNIGEYETEKDRRIALGIERDELNTKLQNEIAARIRLETDLKRKEELENQQRELREKEENANRLRIEQERRQEEARLREETRVNEEKRQAEIRRQEEANRQAEALRIAEINRQNQIKANDKQQKLKEIQDIRNAHNILMDYSDDYNRRNFFGKHAFYTPRYGELQRDFSNAVKNTQFKNLFTYDQHGAVSDPKLFTKLDEVMKQYEEPKPLLVKGLNKEQWIQQIVNNPNRKPNTPLPSMENLTKVFNDIALREQQTAKWREAWSK